MVKTGLKWSVWLVALCIGVGACAAAEKITLMVSGADKLIYLPARLAERLGYLAETGLDIELLSEISGSRAETAMLSGVAQGVIGFYDHTVSLQARGKLVQSVVQFSHAPGEAVLVSRSVAGTLQTPADFRGRSLGITGLGSSTHRLMRYLAAQAGLGSAEYRLLPVGAGASFIAAMNEGRIDAGMTTDPTLSRLLSTNSADILVDLRTPEATRAVLGGSYPGACLYMPVEWVERHPDEARRIAGAFVKALRYIAAHGGAEIAARMAHGLSGRDEALYIEAIDRSRSMFTSDGVMPEDGPATVLRVLSVSDRSLRGKSIHLANTFTRRFVEAIAPD